ncbi:MAG: DUF4157 domain-containing protein [Deltaproteobacteria bacterium]|nr:DUF4157 domain-containing protein [Deltaproteobacteria bacterium]
MEERKLESRKKPQPSQIRHSPKTTNPLFHQPDLLARLGSRARGGPAATADGSRLKRALSSRLAHAGLSLVRLQQRYGNRFVQRVLALAAERSEEQEVSPELEETIDRARGGGRPLDPESLARMEPAFHADFSRVRVHTDQEADSLSQALNARAFTTGRDIFFREGAYDPGSSAGRELLAHELTHVVQQSGEEIKPKLILGLPGDEYEREADEVAKAVARKENRSVERQAEEEKEEEEPIQLKGGGIGVDRQAGEGQEAKDPRETEDAGFGIEVEPGPVTPISKPLSRPVPTTEEEETAQATLQRKSSDTLRIQRITPEAVGAAVAVIAVTYTVVKDIVDALDGDVKYSFDRMRGQKYPRNNKNWEKITPWYSTYVDLSIWRKNGFGTRTGMKVRVHWEYNGYGLSGVYITKRWAGDAPMWGAKFTWLIQPLMAVRKDVNGNPVALVRVVLDGTYTRTLASDISSNHSWIIDGEGKCR